LNLQLLKPDVQKFIDKNLKSDLIKLILKGSPFKETSIQELANQIVAKQKSEKKLPTWFSSENIYYPPKVSIEQTSSEITADYKSKLLKGNVIVDITGGFGVDCYYFSKQFKEVIHCEIDATLSTIVAHNYQQLKQHTIVTHFGDGIQYLKNKQENFDCIYVDPSRRNDRKEKVFLLKDCVPNVPDHLDFLFSKSKQVLLKNSPILDITSAINELKFVKEIHVVAVDNEVKEVLFLLEKGFVGTLPVKTINILKNKTQHFNFLWNSPAESEYSEPLLYLYEPNAALLKSGGFHQVSAQLSIFKLHQHSHLYTSENLIAFPGRIFKIETVLSYDKKQIGKLVSHKKANITTRNFPKTVAQIRQETKIKEGGTLFLFFTTSKNNQLIVIFCSKE
jgi:hypothetical protein